MATFRYVLGKKKGNGRYPVYLRITNKNTNTSLSLPMDVVKSEWRTASQRISIRRTDEHETREEKSRYNEMLDRLTIRTKELERHLKQQGILEELTAAEIKKQLLAYRPNSNIIDGKGDFVEYWNVVAMRKPQSHLRFKYALKHIIGYQIVTYGKDSIQFSDISYDWIACYLAHLKEVPTFQKGRIQTVQYQPRTILTYAACLKTVINCAIDANKLPIEVLRGFRGFKPKITHKEPFTLNINELRELLHYPFPTMRQRMLRDLFFFSFCTMGMNLTDIYHLPKKAVKWGYDDVKINYIRRKTEKLIKVIVPHCAVHIKILIAPYCTETQDNVWGCKADSDYLLALNYNYSIYKTFSNNSLKIIREIRKIMGYDSEFTFYTARDSWATILSRDYQLGQEYIDAGLGHSSRSLAANHYISIDWNTLYDAHAEILHRLFEE